jgi:hypothetical protein
VGADRGPGIESPQAGSTAAESQRKKRSSALLDSLDSKCAGLPFATLDADFRSYEAAGLSLHLLKE